MKRLTSILLMILLSLQLRAQDVSFRHLTGTDGLSHGTVIDSCQDGDGMMWFSTHDGLNRYDGYHFKVFREFSSNLGPQKPGNFFVDSGGVLWVSDGSKLFSYDSEKESFKSYGPFSNKKLRFMVESVPGKMLLFYFKEVKCLDLGDMTIDPSFVPKEIADMSFKFFSKDNDELYLGTDKGRILRWNTVSGEIFYMDKVPSGLKFKCMYGENGTLWAGTEGKGLYKLSGDGSPLASYTEKDGLCSDYVRDLCRDEAGRMWIGTYGGLNILSEDGLRQYYHDPYDNKSLSHNSVRSITRDSQGGMWLSTYYGGVNYWHPLMNEFSPLLLFSTDSEFSGDMQTITEDPDGTLWMGLDRHSIANYNPGTKALKTYPLHSYDNSPKDVKAIYVDSLSGKVYLGSQFGGLNVLDKKTGKDEFYGRNEVARDVISILPRDEGHLYLGTTDGLFLMDKSSRTFSSVPEVSAIKTSVYSIIEDSRGLKWLGSKEGIIIFNDSDGEIRLETLPESLSGIDYVTDIVESGTGDIYICGRKLFRYRPSDGKVDSWTIDDGMPTNVIGDIVEDGSGRMWMYTNMGLCCFNPETEYFRTYGLDAGSGISFFGVPSICRTRSGIIYFGTGSGVMTFNPDHLSENPYSPKPRIKEVRQSGTVIHGPVDLKYDHNTISISFVTMNYLSVGKDIFSFKMEGYDKEWRTQTGVNEVTYYNLPAGRYVFRLRSANNDERWCTEETKLDVRIRPFWTKTLAARLLFALLALIVLAGILIMVYQRREKEHIEEMHQLKTNFFIGFLNELKTPLTLIVSPLQEMIFRSDSSWMRRQLRYVDKNARRLTHMVDQMMSFRKAELGVMGLKATRYELDSLLADIWSCYDRYARLHGLQYRYKSEIRGMTPLADPQYIELMMGNLLSNAFKFTSEGSITLSAAVRDGILALRVSDTGCGIPEDRIEDIFKNGTGVGLALVKLLADRHHGSLEVESTPGSGSSFTILLPQDETLYSPLELGDKVEYVFEGLDMDLMDDAYDEMAAAVGRAGKKGRILLCLTDKNLSSYLLDGLSDSFEVVFSSEEQDAMSKLITEKPDIVITEINDNSEMGIRLCSRIKQSASTSKVPVFILSSKSESRYQYTALQAGADDYMTKPFTLMALSMKISNIIETMRRPSEDTEKQPQASLSEAISQDDAVVARAESIVASRISDPSFSINELVTQMGMSRTSLYMKIKNITGDSPLDFIRNVRFKKASELIIEGGYSIAEISEMVGFSTPSYFTRAFKNYFGMLPSEYKKIVKE